LKRMTARTAKTTTAQAKTIFAQREVNQSQCHQYSFFLEGLFGDGRAGRRVAILLIHVLGPQKAGHLVVVTNRELVVASLQDAEG
jgi:hypothetical protein